MRAIQKQITYSFDGDTALYRRNLNYTFTQKEAGWTGKKNNRGKTNLKTFIKCNGFLVNRFVGSIEENMAKILFQIDRHFDKALLDNQLRTREGELLSNKNMYICGSNTSLAKSISVETKIIY